MTSSSPSRYLYNCLLAIAAIYGFGCRPAPPSPEGAAPGSYAPEPGQTSGATTPTTSDPPAAWLRDVTAETGVDFTYRNGEEADRYTILESLGGGVALFDYDRDGWLDIFVTGGGQFEGTSGGKTRGLPGRLYRNLGEWKFADVTQQTRLAAAPFYSHGCLAGDFDNDGWQDLLITGFGGMTLYANRADATTGRHFVDVTRERGLTDARWCASAAWGDLMGNGRLDLYVCRYLDWSPENDPVCPRRDDPQKRDVCPPQRFHPIPHALYRNDGESFTDVSRQVNLSSGKGLGVVLADLDADSRPDLYVANDDGANLLYVNEGGGKLAEIGMPAGVAVDDNGRYNGSMGVDVGDFDGQGRGSLLVTNYQGELPALYANLGRRTFLHQSQAAGLGALGQGFVGFGAALVDFDNDRWLDLVTVNGHVLRHPSGASFLQRPLLFQNVDRRGRRFFRDASDRGGPFFATPMLGRGLAVGDLDNDGWPDVVVSICNRPITILRNVAGQSKPAHWLGLELAGRGHRPVVGATVCIDLGERQLTLFSKSGGSYMSSSDPRLLAGLGDSTRVEKVTVLWPWGELQTWPGEMLPVDQYWRLEEGQAAPTVTRSASEARSND